VSFKKIAIPRHPLEGAQGNTSSIFWREATNYSFRQGVACRSKKMDEGRGEGRLDEDEGLPRPDLDAATHVNQREEQDEGEYFPGYGSSGNGKVIEKEPPSPRTHILRTFTAGNGYLPKPQFMALMRDLGMKDEQADLIDEFTDEEGRYAALQHQSYCSAHHLTGHLFCTATAFLKPR
jgi:hypothetical protein